MEEIIGKIRKKRLKSLLLMLLGLYFVLVLLCQSLLVFLSVILLCFYGAGMVLQTTREKLLVVEWRGKNIPLHIFRCSCYISNLESNKKQHPVFINASGLGFLGFFFGTYVFVSKRPKEKMKFLLPSQHWSTPGPADSLDFGAR